MVDTKFDALSNKVDMLCSAMFTFQQQWTDPSAISRKRAFSENEAESSLPVVSKIDTITAIMAVFFAAIDRENGTVIPGVVIPTFLTAVKSNSNDVFPNWYRLFRDERAKALASEFSIPKKLSVSFTPYSYLLSAFQSGTILGDSLVNAIESSHLYSFVGLIHFSSPNDTDKDFTQLKKDSADETSSSRVQQPERFQAKKHAKLYVPSTFDSDISSILSSIANFFVFAKTIVHTVSYDDNEHNPFILVTLAKIAALIDNPEVASIIKDYSAKYPYFIHAMVSVIHGVFAATANLVLGNTLINSYNASDPADRSLPIEPFLPIIDLADETVKMLKGLRNNLGNFGPLINEPTSYEKFHPRPTAIPVAPVSSGSDRPSGPATGNPSKRPRCDYNRTAHGSGEWLVLKPGKKFVDFKPGEQFNFCLRYAIFGSSCPDGLNCSRPHMGWNDVPAALQTTIRTFMSTSAGSTICSLASQYQ